MSNIIPRYLFFTRGVGIAEDKLTSFEDALRDAGIQMLNLVKVSSIIPPKCRVIDREEGKEFLEPGRITFVVLARNESNRKGDVITASIGYAYFKSLKEYGYLSEYEGFNEDEYTSSEKAKDIAINMLKTINKNEKDEIISGSITQAITVNNKKWHTVISAAVLI